MAAAPHLLQPEVHEHKRYFFTHLGLSERLLERCLGEALSAGGDFADLYFEAVTSTSLGMDEGIVKTAAQGISVGCGVRVLSGERTGFAYTGALRSDSPTLDCTTLPSCDASRPRPMPSNAIAKPNDTSLRLGWTVASIQMTDRKRITRPTRTTWRLLKYLPRSGPLMEVMSIVMDTGSRRTPVWNASSPRKNAELVSETTSQFCATICIHVPMLEVQAPNHWTRKSR